jgi:hypothetical protein
MYDWSLGPPGFLNTDCGVFDVSKKCKYWAKLTANKLEAEFTNVLYSFIEVSVLRLEVSVWISKTIGKGVWFFIMFSSFLLYRNCKRLLDLEEIEISRQSYRGDCEQQGGKLLRLLSGFRPRIRPPE